MCGTIHCNVSPVLALLKSRGASFVAGFTIGIGWFPSNPIKMYKFCSVAFLL